MRHFVILLLKDFTMFFSEVHGAGRQLRVWHGRKGNNCHGPDRILGDDLYSGADQLLGPFESNINT